MFNTLGLDSPHVHNDAARLLAAWLNDLAEACAP